MRIECFFDDDIMMDDGDFHVTGLQINKAKYGRKRFVPFFNLEFDTGTY